MKNLSKKQGISLIVLILTIIIIIILATAIIQSFSSNNPIEKAKEATFLNDMKTIEEDVNMYALNKQLDNYNYDITDINLAGDEMVKEIPSTKKYKEKIEIISGKIFLKESATEQEKEWANKNNIQVEKNTLKKLPVSMSEIGNTFFGIEITRPEITKIIFENTTSNAPDSAIDVSAEGNRGILGWLSGTEVHIASNYTIYANQDSAYLFGFLSKCTAIENLNLLNTSETTNMDSMFLMCNKLTSIDLSKFDTSNVTDMHYMFYECKALTELDVSKFNTSKVTDMQYMFQDCTNLKTIYATDKFDTNKVTNSGSMFENCTSLVGGNGTKYNENYTDKTYARIDKSGTPGYFTLKK